jgi:hypothetical protein
MKIIRANLKWTPLMVAVLMFGCSAENSSNRAGTLQKAVDAADETAAIQTLRTITSAQAQAKAIRGSYSDFDGLVQGGFLDQRFANSSPTLRGYRFTISSNAEEFSVNADPEGQLTGRHLYIDSTDNVIHVNSTASANRNDPAL